jgi:uncharacterized protein (TIGR02246 family)
MKLLAALILTLITALPASARPTSEPRATIVAALDDSARGWNRGDVDGFLAVYSDDPATSFTGSKSVDRGKASIRVRYLTNYKAQFGADKAATRSTLTFDVQDFRMLGDRHALLIARWKLVTPGKDAPATGMTSLVFRKEAGGWHIIADHS